MKPLGRYQWRVRSLLLLPFLVPFAWCLAGWIVEWSLLREDYRAQAALHAKEALTCQTFANSPIPATQWFYAVRPGRTWTCGNCCVRLNRPLSEAEKAEARRLREQARRRADHHRALRRKYALAAWLPFLPVAPDPPPPDGG